MRKVGPNTYAEFYLWGCNPGFLVTADGIVLFDTPLAPISAMRWRETIEAIAPIRHLINTEPHADHTTGNAYFPHVEVIGHELLRETFHHNLWRVETLEQKIARIKVMDPDSVFLIGHPDYPLEHPPTRTFKDELTLQLGSHHIICLHTGGHTTSQTTILLPEEGVAFIGDNFFHKCKTWIHESDPWDWLAALDKVEALPVEVIVPGHGEPCKPSYAKVQRQVIENWLGAVESLVDRGLTEQEAVDESLDFRSLDPYPIAQNQFASEARTNTGTIRNIYRRIVARRAGVLAPG